MGDQVLRVEGLGKQYRIGARRRYRTLRETIGETAAAPYHWLRRKKAPDAEANRIWALRDLSFEVKRGEVVGVIGRNGAGKSTLLKVLSQITEPTTGEVEIRGRVGSLLEVGTGFHPELTGRENVFLNGAILGMKRAEIVRRFDEIVAFAEVEQFLDTPVKRYSSGMYMRLAFAVAAHMEPEILIVDEVLAVGDAQFQAKCLGKMGEVAKGGRTVLFVSHNMATIRQLTTRCIYLQAGHVVCTDETSRVADRYLEDSVKLKQDRSGSLEVFRRGNLYESSVKFRQVCFLTDSGQETGTFRPGDSFRIEATIEASEPHERACVSFWIANDRGERVSTFFSGDAGFWFQIAAGLQRVSCTVIGLPLSPGRYTATLGINRTANTLAFDVLVDYPAFDVVLPELETGCMDLAHRTWGCVHWTQVAWQQS